MSKLKAAIAARQAPATLERIPAKTLPEVNNNLAQYADLVPDLGERIDDPAFEQANKTIDELVERLGIIGAYKTFIRKMEPKKGRKSESIMISCPLPWHEDKNPSAWMNSDKNTWFCGGCQRGGDTYDLAAIGLGFDIDSYKTNSFVELRHSIAQHFGYEVYQAPGQSEIIYEPEKPKEKPATQASPSPITDKTEKAAEKTERTPTAREKEFEAVIEAKIEEKLKSSEYTLNWREIVKPDTFLDKYMQAATKDYNVEEFHFWNAMLALGMAAGRNVFANDNPKVYGNIYVCLMGGSGSGKTKSRRYLDSMLFRVLPFREDADYPDGVKEIPTPNSAEYLIKSFSKPVMGVSASGAAITVGYASVRGVIRFEELSSFKAIAGRTGSDLGSRMLEFYDCKDRITTGSRATGDTIAVDPFASAFTTTQPRALSKILSRADEESGFLNRWLFVGGRAKKGKFWGGETIDLSEADKELFRIHAWARESRTVELSPEAEFLANRDLSAFIIPDKDAYDPALGRIDLTIKKLCLLFAINEMSTVITQEIYERVMKMYPYIKAYAIFRSEYLDEVTAKSETDMAVVEKIQEIFTKTAEWPTARELMRGLHRKINGTQELMRTLEALVKADVIQSDTESRTGRGRPATRYKIEGVA